MLSFVSWPQHRADDGSDGALEAHWDPGQVEELLAVVGHRARRLRKARVSVVLGELGKELQALGWARKVPMRSGSIEIRQVMDLSRFGLREQDSGPVGSTA